MAKQFNEYTEIPNTKSKIAFCTQEQYNALYDQIPPEERKLTTLKSGHVVCEYQASDWSYWLLMVGVEPATPSEFEQLLAEVA